MHAVLMKILERLTRAPLSTGVACFGLGIIFGKDLITHFRLSNEIVELTGTLTAGLGIFFFGANCRNDGSCKKK